MKILDILDIDIENLDRCKFNLGIEVLDLADRYGGVLIESKTHTCCRCGKTTPNNTGICRCRDLKLIKHHISYTPEIMVKICDDCHDDIHNSKWGAPTNSDGTIDFSEYDKYLDYKSSNRFWIMYEGFERDEFYANREDLKIDKYGNKESKFENGFNVNWSTLKTGVGIGMCMKCGLPSCSFYGCFIKNHECKNPKVGHR